jgi:putative peptide zinc metalloprotease protein
MTTSTLEAPALAPGVSLLGEYQGSGFTEPHYLIVRADQQVLHVSRLIFVVASHLDGRSRVDEVAARVSAEYGRTLDAEGVQFLVTAKLRPMGIAAEAPAGPPSFGLPVANAPVTTTPTARTDVPPPARTLPRANPLLALRFRGTLLPAGVTRTLARLLAPLFFGPVVALGLLAVVVADVWLLQRASLAGAVDSVLVDPPMLLSVVGILLGATVIHELGHAAASRYGGAPPGKIGVAVYVVYPAFFTDVTESYRLGRAGRVRTDLGGVYFNALTIAGLTAVYAQTRSPAVLLAIVFVHVEALQQLLPLGRLDGYFVVADLVGVPDLFGRIGPILRSAIPGRATDPKVAELRRSARVVVTLWVLLAGPVMVGMLGFLIWNLPSITAQVVEAMSREWTQLLASLDEWNLAGLLLSALSLVLLPLPLLGLAWLVGGILRRVVTAVFRHRPAPASPPTATPTPLRTADELTERFLLRAQPHTPGRGWRRGVFAVTRGRINPGPSEAERREDALLARVRTRFDGSRRVVVLSRKGGAGKTTTTLMLGHTFATHRGDRVVALDANPDAGSLGMRLPRETASSATDLLAERSWVERYSQIRAFTSQDPVTRLEVVASDDDARITSALGAQDYRHLVDALDRHYTLLLVDTGTGILDDAIQGILAEADQLVVVMPPALDGGRVAAMTLDWLDEHGHHDLVARSVAVVNAVRGSGPLELDRLEQHFAARCASVHRIPWDPVLEAGAHSALADLRPATRAAYLELAGAVAEGFLRTGHSTGGIPTGEQS